MRKHIVHLINWFKIEDIRRKLEKYDEKCSKIEDDVSLLMSKFDLSELRFAVVASLAKLGLDITVLPARKSNKCRIIYLQYLVCSILLVYK